MWECRCKVGGRSERGRREQGRAPAGMAGPTCGRGRSGGRASWLVVLAAFLAHVALLSEAASSRVPAGVLRLRGGKTGGIKARDMWAKPIDELSQMEEELRMELMSLRVAQQVGGQPGRVNQIGKVRKSIARVLTVITAKRRAEAYELVQKDKYKPLDARKNRNMPKAMRQRLNKYERTRMSSKAVRCLRLKIWGAGVRPMRRIVLKAPMDDVVLGMCGPEEERTFEKYPARRKGQYGKKTDTGHMPVHAELAREKIANKRKKEAARRQAFRAKYEAEDSE